MVGKLQIIGGVGGEDKSKSLLCNILTNICQILSFNFPNCFPTKLLSLKVHKSILKRSFFSLSWTKRFVFPLLGKSSNQPNCQNSLCSQGMKMWYFLLNEHAQIFQYGSTLLTNKYCKTGLRKRTLLWSWLVKAWW